MYTIDLNQAIHVHFIGIGGISMSGLAEILIRRGFTITGSDVGVNNNITKLKELGASITRGHMATNITDEIDLIVYTVAVKDNNVEMIEAHKRKLPIIDRATLLGQVMDHYRDSIAVSGTHGKTTTTSMIAHILTAAKVDPTISVGGILPMINGNISVGHSSYFITEACEYYDSFHHFYPEVAVVLNVEEDHLDYFEDLAHIHRSFHRFLGNIKEGGKIIIHKDIKDLSDLIDGYEDLVSTYSASNREADYYADNLSYSPMGYASFDILHENKVLITLSLNVPGLHNVANAIASYITAKAFNLSDDAIKEGLLAFGGTHRRFQYKGSLGGVTIIDDYAHHPTEIEATIASTKNMTFNKLWIVFQPHTFSRTKAFLKDFAQALSKADHIILMDIYSASREEDLGDIHAKDMQALIQEMGTPCDYFETIDEIVYHVMTHCVPNDLLITMGAGDVYLVGESLLDL